MSRRQRQLVTTTSMVVAIVTAALATSAMGAPTKLRYTGRFGRHVDLTQVQAKGGLALEDLCTVESSDMCQAGSESTDAGGFAYADSVAVDPEVGTVYVADFANNRVEEFSASGQFILTFGWDVDRTKVEKGASQEERNVCMALSKDVCQAGEAGTGASEQLNTPQDIVVDPISHNVYVAELSNKRIDEYTPAGRFVMMIGGDVNRTIVEEGGSEPERNVCTALSKDVCQVGQFSPTTLTSGLTLGFGNLLAIGPSDVLYVGDGEGIQEFGHEGEYLRGISLVPFASEGAVRALAVGAGGELYVSYAAGGFINQREGIVYELDSNGAETSHFDTPHEVFALAVDPDGGIVVSESGQGYGVRYSVTGAELGIFAPPGGAGSMSGLAFGVAGAQLYSADSGMQDVETYEAAPVAEPVTSPSPTCLTGVERDTSVTFDCVLMGEVNPESVGSTAAWFEYGSTPALGSKTSIESVVTGDVLVPIKVTVIGLRPNEQYYYRLAVEDKNTGGEAVYGKILVRSTPPVAPRSVCGEPQVAYVTFSSALLSCVVNPENANTVYRFQYGICANITECSGVLETAPLESAAYGSLAVAQTVKELMPSTTYRYRLTAINEHEEAASGQEGSFTTAPLPSPIVSTEAASEVTATSATVNGVVEASGIEATYMFELGVYNGANTVYSTIASGPTSAESETVGESFTLAGLQPGTTYSYRLAVANAYGVVSGGPVQFTTLAPLAVLAPPVVPTLLTMPKISFPTEHVAKKLAKCKKDYQRRGNGKCQRLKKAKVKVPAKHKRK
jgi:hypothetical protein